MPQECTSGGATEYGRSGVETPNKYNKNCNTHYGLVKQPASFLVVRLIPQEGALWGMGFKIHGWRKCMKTADQEQ